MRRQRRTKHAVYKDNLWNKMRRDRGLTFKDIGAILGVSSETVRRYFIGSQMPRKEQIQVLCEGFNVDVEEGTLEFRKMHKSWKQTQSAKDVKSTIDTVSMITDIPDNISDEAIEVLDSYIESEEEPSFDIFEILYNNISYKEFIYLQSICGKSTDYRVVLPFIYNKVDFDTFIKIYRMVKS